MTEADWLACKRPKLMLEFLQGKASGRKFRLFAVACCRRLAHLLIDEECRAGLDVAERYADGLATEEERQASCATLLGRGVGPNTKIEAWEVWLSASQAIGFAAATDNFFAATTAWRFALDAALTSAVANPSYPVADSDDEVLTEEALAFSWAEMAVQCELVRDIFGNPFRPVAVDAAWIMPGVLRQAQAAYAGGPVENLRRLANALKRAGCTSAEILSHCRGSGPHVLGCWVVDLLLGKEYPERESGVEEEGSKSRENRLELAVAHDGPTTVAVNIESSGPHVNWVVRARERRRRWRSTKYRCSSIPRAGSATASPIP